MNDLIKIIFEGKHICVNRNTFDVIQSKIKRHFSMNPSDSFPVFRSNYYGHYTHSGSSVFLDSMKDNYIKIFLDKGVPIDINNGWSPAVPIDKIANLLKLKAFL